MMDDELLKLKNLGKTSVQLLNAVGIRNEDELRRYGAIHAYRAVRSKGFRPSKMLLYAIEGALLDRRWNELSLERKTFLSSEVDALH
jgi:DNA transformation protein